MKPVILWVQKWEESEAGWGTRPDGYTLHLTLDHIDAFLDAMRAREAEQGYGRGNPPPEYDRPCGKPYQTVTEDEALVARVLASDHGIWGPNGNTYPAPVLPGADQSGWVTLKPGDPLSN